MPFTLAGFGSDPGAAATLAYIAGLADPHIRVMANDVFVPDELAFILAYYIQGAVATDGRIESPSLRRLTNLHAIPLNLAVLPASPQPLVDMSKAPKAVDGSEGLNCRATVTAAGRVTGLVWLGDGPITPVVGEIFTVRATTVVTCVANAWTNGPLTFVETLPKGRYQVVGARAMSTNLVAFRLVFSGYAWRPGALGTAALSAIQHQVFRAGQLGVWGEFDHDLPPTVDFLANAADTNPIVWLDLIKIA